MTEPQIDGVPLREYIEALLSERQQASELAEREREKAAGALRETLRDGIRSGDAALERHIDAQVESVRLALDAQQRLSATVDAAAKEAVTLALENAKELAEKHNDLIRQGEREKEKFATKDDLAHHAELSRNNAGQAIERNNELEQRMAKLVRTDVLDERLATLVQVRAAVIERLAEIEKRMALMVDRDMLERIDEQAQIRADASFERFGKRLGEVETLSQVNVGEKIGIAGLTTRLYLTAGLVISAIGLAATVLIATR